MWIATQGSPRSMLTAAISDLRFANALPEGAPVQLITKTVDLCVQDAWNSTPPWLEKLFVGLNLIQNEPSIAALWQVVSQRKPPPVADVLAGSILNGSIPFVNRTDFRKRLKTLVDPVVGKQRPILVIGGATKTGKSYSARYIDHFANRSSGVTQYPLAPFNPEQAEATGPEEIASDFVSMMGRPLDTRPLPTTNKDRYGVELAQWVFNQAAQSGGQHWFILDNFRGDKLRPDTRNFLKALTSLVVAGRYPDFCRLILIDIDLTLLGADTGKVDNEDVKVCKLTDIDIVVAELNQLLPSVAANTLRRFIVDNLPANHPKMPELNRHLRLLLLAMTRLSGILPAGADAETILLEMLRDLPPDGSATDELRTRLTALEESVEAL